MVDALFEHHAAAFDLVKARISNTRGNNPRPGRSENSNNGMDCLRTHLEGRLPAKGKVGSEDPDKGDASDTEVEKHAEGLYQPKERPEQHRRVQGFFGRSNAENSLHFLILPG